MSDYQILKKDTVPHGQLHYKVHTVFPQILDHDERWLLQVQYYLLLHNLDFLTNIIKMRQAGNTACMGGTRNAYNSLVRKCEENRPL
jgi:hypothetical protein